MMHEKTGGCNLQEIVGMLQLLFELENFDKKLCNKGINKELQKKIFGIEIRIINNTVISSSAKYFHH